MSEIRITSTELARSLGEVLGRLRYRGDSFVIEKNGKPVAILSPYPAESPRSLKNALRAWLEAGERDEDLAKVLEELRSRDRELEDPWESR